MKQKDLMKSLKRQVWLRFPKCGDGRRQTKQSKWHERT